MCRTPDGLRHRTTEFRASAHGPCRTDKWSYPHPSPPRARDRRWRDLRRDPVVWARSRILKGQVQKQASGQGNEISWNRSEEHTSELQSLMRSSYAVFCLKKKIN